MKIIAAALVCLLSAGDSAFAQQAATPQAATPQAASAQATPAQTTPSAPPPPNTLLDGTAVKLRLAENLTSATA